jgi:hypothetical protein
VERERERERKRDVEKQREMREGDQFYRCYEVKRDLCSAFTTLCILSYSLCVWNKVCLSAHCVHVLRECDL